MGSDVTEFFESEEQGSVAGGSLDPLAQLVSAEKQGKIDSVLDPFDIFGFQKEGDIQAAGEASRLRIGEFMRSAEAMRQDVLTRIQDRDLQASKAAANARREARLRTGRASTILSR